MLFILLFIPASIFGIYGFLWYYLKFSTNWCQSQTCLLGKTAIVTGANSGIGFETALDFAKRGARVVLACRDLKKAEEAKNIIIAETGNTNVVVKILDLSSFYSVRSFAKDIIASEERLDILVNNAGISGVSNLKSIDDNCLMMQVNHFSSFLLTNLLINLLKKSAPSRIINVSSLRAAIAFFSIKIINNCSGAINTYSCSKLCNILFTIQLAKILEGSGVSSYSIHPGVVKTPIIKPRKGPFKIIHNFLKNTVFRTPAEGAQTTIYAAVTKGIEHLDGEHFDNCQKVSRYYTARSSKLAKQVWSASSQIVKLDLDIS